MVQYLQFGFCMQICSAVGTLDPPSRNRVKNNLYIAVTSIKWTLFYGPNGVRFGDSTVVFESGG